MHEAAVPQRIAQLVHKEGVPNWPLIGAGLVVAAWNGLGLIGNHPTVQIISNKLGVGRIVAWTSAYPPWQTPGMKRVGRIGAVSLGLALVVWGALLRV